MGSSALPEFLHNQKLCSSLSLSFHAQLLQHCPTSAVVEVFWVKWASRYVCADIEIFDDPTRTPRGLRLRLLPIDKRLNLNDMPCIHMFVSHLCRACRISFSVPPIDHGRLKPRRDKSLGQLAVPTVVHSYDVCKVRHLHHPARSSNCVDACYSAIGSATSLPIEP